jgi:hypothetical protein
MKKHPTIYRQGDVLIERIASIPKTATKQKAENGRIILAHGEATGHHHSLDIDSADWWKSGTDQFLNVTNPAKVVHQEHGAIELPRGKYRVLRQREYSPEAIRNVAD